MLAERIKRKGQLCFGREKMGCVSVYEHALAGLRVCLHLGVFLGMLYMCMCARTDAYMVRLLLFVRLCPAVLYSRLNKATLRLSDMGGSGRTQLSRIMMFQLNSHSSVTAALVCLVHLQHRSQKKGTTKPYLHLLCK